MSKSLLCALILMTSACGTLTTVETLHPELAAHEAEVVAFTQCADILAAPLVKHFQGVDKLTVQEILDLAIEAIRCGNHVNVDAASELAKSAAGLGSPAVSVPAPVVVPAVPASQPSATPNAADPVIPSPYAQ